jgi:stage IV sporulation protein FB
MVRFTIFGVPVEIQPWFWLTAAILSRGIDARTPEQFKLALLFIFAATISILVHEFGHALVGRRLGGGRARVVLWAFGGLAYNEGGRFTRWQRFWMIAAGPGAGFALFLLLVAVLLVAFGPRDGATLVSLGLFNTGGGVSSSTAAFFSERYALFSLISDFLWINFWWGLVNLLPVMPLDGGQITELFVKPRKRVHEIALVAAVAMALVGALWLQSIYVTLLFGYLAWKNYQDAKAITWQ